MPDGAVDLNSGDDSPVAAVVDWTAPAPGGPAGEAPSGPDVAPAEPEEQFDVGRWMAESDAQAALAASEAASGAARAASLAAEAALSALSALEVATGALSARMDELEGRVSEAIELSVAGMAGPLADALAARLDLMEQRLGASLDSQVAVTVEAANAWFVRTRNELFGRIDAVGARLAIVPIDPLALPGDPLAPATPFAVASVNIDRDAMWEVLEPISREVQELQGEVAAMGQTVLRVSRDLQALQRAKPAGPEVRIERAQLDALVRSLRAAVSGRPQAPRPPRDTARSSPRPSGQLSEDFGSLAQLMDDPLAPRSPAPRSLARKPDARPVPIARSPRPAAVEVGGTPGPASIPPPRSPPMSSPMSPPMSSPVRAKRPLIKARRAEPRAPGTSPRPEGGG